MSSSKENRPVAIALILGIMISLLAYVVVQKYEKDLHSHTEITAIKQAFASEAQKVERGTLSGPVNPSAHSQSSRWIAPLVLLSGLLLTGLVVIYIRTNLREKSKVERLVEARTRSLHESQERMQATLDNLLEGVITIDERGLVETMNPAAEAIFGYSAAEVSGKNIKMLMPEPYQHQHDTYLQNYLETGKRKIIGYGREVQGLRKNGEVFPLDLAVNEVRLHDRRVFIGMTRDITERKIASRELDRFKYVLDNTLDMIFMFRVDDLRFIYLNRGAVESMGYSEQELLQMTPYDIKPQYNEDAFRATIKPMLEGREDVVHFETVHRHKDGTDFPVEIFLQIVRETEGGGRFIAIVRDITERKHAEQQTKRYADALEDLHKITSQSDVDFDRKLTAMLELGCKVFQLPMGVQSRIEGQRFIIENAVGPEGSVAVGTEMHLSETYCDKVCEQKHALGQHHVGVSELRTHPCYLKHGLEAHIAAPLIIKGVVYGTMNFSGLDPLDKPFSEGDYSLIKIFAQWLSNEIARQQIQDDMRDNAARLATILDTAIDAIITFNDAGNIESINQAGLTLFGYQEGELQGEAFFKLLPPAEAKEYMQYLQNFLQTGEAHVIGRMIEANGLRKDGSLVPIEFAANEMLLGDRHYFTAVVRDITERKKVDRMKNEFVSTVSHELRTPLTSIRGALSLVQGMTNNGVSDKARHLLDMAERNSERLTYLINDILDLEKIDAGQLDFDFEQLDLAKLIGRAIEENDSFANAHHVRLNFSDNTEDAVTVYADQNRLLQVLANLISNAVKFSPENAEVIVALEKVGSQCRVSVKDSGPGIPESFRPRVFMRFAQADSSDTRARGGTGLGLAISRAIIERLGGHIRFNTAMGQGTEFFFELPEWKKARPPRERDADTPTVLICEDNADVAEVLTSLLEQDGFQSDHAASLHEARSLLEQGGYQLLLLDLMLPDGDGLQLVQEIRNTDSLAQLPVIIVSARAEAAQQEFRGDAFSIVDWLEKPVDRARLSKALHQVLVGHKRPHVLHVEDDLDVVQVTQALLEEIGDIDFVTSLQQARERIRNAEYDLLILDLSLPDGSGLDLLDELQGTCPVVIFSGLETEKNISQKVSAALTKSRTDGEQLLRTVRRVMNQSLAKELMDA